MFGKGGCRGEFGRHMHGPFGGFGPMGGPFDKAFGGGKCGPGALLQGLDLTDEQVLKIAELKGKVFSKIARAKLDLMELKKELFKELLQPQADKAKVRAIAEKIKAHKSECVDAMAENMVAFSEILTAEQKGQLRLGLVRKFLGLEELDDEDDED